jgi:hypothetical protein
MVTVDKGTSRRARFGWRGMVLGISAAVLLAASPIASVAASSLPYLVTTPATRVDGPSDFTGPGVQRFSVSGPSDLALTSYYAIEGIPTGTGFSYPFAVRVFDGVVFFQEVAVDATTNRILMEVGTTASANLKSLLGSQPGYSAASSGVVPPINALGPLSLINTSGWFLTMWLDIANLTLNSVVDYITWTYDTGTGRVSNLVYQDGRSWASWNGWAEIYHYNSGYYNGNHTVATGYTNDTFRTSNWFPLPTCGTTTTYYAANNAYGYGNGNIGGGANTWSTSGCLFMMHYTGYAGR